MNFMNGSLRKTKMGIKADPELRKMLVRSRYNEIMLDLDGDGLADICLSDESGTGDIDTISYDLTGNGEFNLYLHDIDGNGVPDTIFWADDNSEKMELIASGTEVEDGLIEMTTRVYQRAVAEEFAQEEFGMSLEELAVFMRANMAALAEEVKRRTEAEGVDKVFYFLDDAGTYFLATEDGDQARVRPFGTILLHDDKLYIQTGKSKEVSKQIAANPKVEICAFMDGKWLRVSGELVNDDNKEVKEAMLEKMPQLKGMYSADDDNMQMLYFKDATATFSSFTAEPEEIRF